MTSPDERTPSRREPTAARVPLADRWKSDENQPLQVLSPPAGPDAPPRDATELPPWD